MALAQTAVPLTSPEHFVQLAPQALASSLAAHVVPQGWYPFPQVTAQVVPMHVAVTVVPPAPVPPI